MFAVIYKASIHPHREKEYQELWHKVSTHFVKKRGSLGSSLHKTDEGHWVIYSRWPDKATRDASWSTQSDEPCPNLDPEIQTAVKALKDCIDKNQPLTEICMDVVEDLLTKNDIHNH